MTRIAWLLNLDAERELAAPRAYSPTPAIEARIGTLRARMELLLAPDDRLVAVDELAGCELGLAFCPTPSALARLQATALPLLTAPALAILARVNRRAFCAELGQTLPGAHYVTSLDALLAALHAGAPDAVWLLKRDFAFAGRERRRVYGRELDPPTTGFVRRSFARGEGLQLEPLLARTADFAQHGYVLPDGTLLLGSPYAQVCDERGAWQHSSALEAGALRPHERAALEQRCMEAGEALVRAGYRGPFGIDAFRYRTSQGDAFQPRSEINARFSMGYPRPLLELALARIAAEKPARL